jgi:hypothetical protein
MGVGSANTRLVAQYPRPEVSRHAGMRHHAVNQGAGGVLDAERVGCVYDILLRDKQILRYRCQVLRRESI